MQERETRPTVEHERGNRDLGGTLRRQGIVAHDGGVVGERVGECLLRWPPRRTACLGDELRRHADHLRHEVLGSVATLSRRDEIAKGLRRVRRRPRESFGNVWRLPQCGPGYSY